MANKVSRTEFKKQLAQFAADQRALIEAEVSGFSRSREAQLERVNRALNDFRFFCRTYFPHFIRDESVSQFHQCVYDDIPTLIGQSSGNRIALAAPRGESKSTLLTQLFSIYEVATESKHFLVIVMDSFDQAAMMLEAIKAELDSNPRLRQDFPAIFGRGRVWQAGVVVTRNNIKIQVAGTGKKVRGWRHGPYRPDLLLLDDIENDENVRKKEQRDKTEDWLQRSALKMGPPDGTMDVIYVGTILHYDSVLARTMKNPVWDSRLFRAIIRWPDNMRMWDEWERVLRASGKGAAYEFYRQNERLLTQGAVVSWPEVRPLLALMVERAGDHRAFDSEMQNDPTNDEQAPFKSIQYWVEPVSHWIFYGVCDPSLGRLNKGRDPSAILIGGLNRETGVLDVVEADIQRRVPDKIISDIIRYQKDYGCLLWGVETVQFQEFLRTELVKRSAAQGVPVPARALLPNTDKALRIESLQPHVENGLIRLHQSQKTLYTQLRHWPEADHDDGPDALHMLWMLATTGAGGIPQIRSVPRTHGINYRGYSGG